MIEQCSKLALSEMSFPDNKVMTLKFALASGDPNKIREARKQSLKNNKRKNKSQAKKINVLPDRGMIKELIVKLERNAG